MSSEEDEVRALLMRHRKQIIRDFSESKLVSVLAEKGVLSNSNEELFNKYSTSPPNDDDSPQSNTIKSVANDDDVNDQKCSFLIDAIAKNGFEKFKEFCYAIESECPQLIEDLINDRLKSEADNKIDVDENKDTNNIKSATTDSNRSKSSRQNSGDGIITTKSATPSRRSSSVISSPVVTAPLTSNVTNMINNYSPPVYAIHDKLAKISTSTAAVATTPSIVPDASAIITNEANPKGTNYSSLLCYQSATPPSPPSSLHTPKHAHKVITSSLAIEKFNIEPEATVVKKRSKLRHRFSDVGSWGRKKKERNPKYHSIHIESLEVLGEPVVEDEFFSDRTSWEYHTVPVTRVPGYGFGIAVSGGKDNPHFATGDPSIAVSDVLKGGPAEDRLQVNDRIISVNGIPLDNVDYATAVQVLRDSGNTVTLVVKRRVPNLSMITGNSHSHQHSNSLVSSNGLAGTSTNVPLQSTKIVLTKSSKKEDFGIVLGCRLFVKELSSKARDQLALNGYTLQEGDVITRLNNTNTNDAMSMKEARKIIDSCKERLSLVVVRDGVVNGITPNGNSGMQSSVYSHTAQVSNCSNPDDNFLGVGGSSSYSTQNLYVQPPTRPNPSSIMNLSTEDKNNLTPHGRSRNPLMDVSLMQLDRPSSPTSGLNGHLRSRSNGGTEDFYGSRRQLYDEDPLQRSKQSAEPRFISFQKEGSVGIRLTGGNEAGIFVTAVQPGSPASLQGLTPGDKILKVNDMDMMGVTREEAVLFLLSLQDRIDLIVQHCKEDYDSAVASQRGDSFHIKTHFHCDTPTKGEMSFKAGDVFRVVDTLHNGVVGSWQVLRIGQSHQEMQRGVIPNKSRAEELATAQFNATKKEMNASESRTSFFRRRKSSNHRRSKSLSRENWDDVVFSDSISKFPAYERVVLRHPGFVRPVVLFGPVADLARERLIKDFPDKFTAPMQADEKVGNSSSKSAIIRLSNIRDIMDRGKHALLDITPNAVDRLNYAQFYPIVIFLKTDNKHTIKQLRHGIPKSAHKSSKKLLEQCQKLDRIWSHVFSNTITLNETDAWYRKLRDIIDQLQSGAVWMSETKPVESLSDDFLFPMTTSRLSYASSPESDLELSPGPSTSLSLGNLPQLVKASSDPSIATNQDNLERDRELNNIGDGLMPPPYTNPYEDSTSHLRHSNMESKYAFTNDISPPLGGQDNYLGQSRAPPPAQPLYGTAPDLPPRIDRTSKPNGVTPPSTLLPTPSSRSHQSSLTNGNGGTYGRSAHDRLFNNSNKPSENPTYEDEYSTRPNLLSTPEKRNSAGNSLDRNQNSINEKQPRTPSSGGTANGKTNGSYDSVSSYDSCNNAMQSLRLGPNAPDDLKSVPNINGRIGPPAGNEPPVTSPRHSIHHSDSVNNRSKPLVTEHSRSLSNANDLNKVNSTRPYFNDSPHLRNVGDSRAPNQHDMRPSSMAIPHRPTNLGLDLTPPRKPHAPLETKTDYGKYSRNNSVSQADYSRTPKSPQQPPHQSLGGGNVPFKPVPPPKPKNYRPPIHGAPMNSSQWENGEPTSPRSPNGFYYPPTPSHYHHSQQSSSVGMHHGGPPIHSYSQQQYGNNNGNGHYQVQPPNHYGGNTNGYNGNQSYNGGQYMPRAPGYGGNLPTHHPNDRHALDLAGSREQRGSAFELYRKPQIGGATHHHNISSDWDHQYYNQSQRPYYSDRSQMPDDQRSILYDHQFNNTPPPLPPPKSAKIKFLKSPLVAIKNAFLKTTKPLRRQNSMVEPKDQRPRVSHLRRQHSMMEYRPSGYNMRSPECMQLEQRYYADDNYHRQYNYQRHEPYYQQDGNTNYANCGYDNRGGYDNRMYNRGTGYNEENLYANRAFIELERQTTSGQRGGPSYDDHSDGGERTRSSGGRIVRRHSMADRSISRESPMFAARSSHRERSAPRDNSRMDDNRVLDVSHRDDIYQTRSGAFMMEERNPRSNRAEEAIYQSRREMHLDHLYQSKKEMQQRIHQGRLEVERAASSESPSIPSSTATTPTVGDGTSPVRETIYATRKELKERGFKTRTQLRDHIYQTRREALESMAEPIYVSSKQRQELPKPPEPSIAEVRENDSLVGPTSSEQLADDSISSMVTLPVAAYPLLTTTIFANQNSRNSTGSVDMTNEEETMCPTHHTDPQQNTMTDNNPITDSDVVSEAGKMPLSPRADRSHISNIIKRVASQPPPPPSIAQPEGSERSNTNVNASRTSIETNYTLSVLSLPTGPPAAHSTPYASEAMLDSDTFYPPLREPSTTRGTFDETGGTLSDSVWKVSIDIPAGAIPPGRQQEIYFTVTDPRMSQTVGGPPLDMENGETMLSPLVMCGPQGLEFLVPVTLNIPHCASRTASLGLSLKATDSESNLETNWENIDLPSNSAPHTVSVKVDHF